MENTALSEALFPSVWPERARDAAALLPPCTALHTKQSPTQQIPSACSTVCLFSAGRTMQRWDNFWKGMRMDWVLLSHLRKLICCRSECFFAETATHYPLGPIGCEVEGSCLKRLKFLPFCLWMSIYWLSNRIISFYVNQNDLCLLFSIHLHY